MTWIISDFNSCEFHTDIRAVCTPIISRVRELNWFLNDIEMIYIEIPEVPGVIDYNTDSAFLKGNDFADFVLNYSVQFVWGFLSAGNYTSKEPSRESLPGIFDICNKGLDKNRKMIIPASEIEIYCFDSTSTTIKFKHKKDYEGFVNYYKL